MSTIGGTGSRQWAWIQGLLLTGGLALLVLLVASLVVWSGNLGAWINIVIYLIPPGLALVAVRYLRRGDVGRGAWFGLAVGVTSLLLALITGFFIPVIRPVMDLVQFFSVREVIFFLVHMSFVVLTVAGFWALVAYQTGKSRSASSPGQVSATQVLYDADGNPVTVMYPTQTSTLAVIAFVLVWLVTPVGLILGYVAISEIRQSGGAKSGVGLARAAIILGWIFVALSALAIVVIFSTA